jgi:hypothetical protein
MHELALRYESFRLQEICRAEIVAKDTRNVAKK